MHNLKELLLATEKAKGVLPREKERLIAMFPDLAIDFKTRRIF